MNISKILSTTLLAIAPLSLPVFAGPYVTGSIGNSNIEFDDISADFSSSTAWSFGGGYAFNDIIAIEANYLNLGTFDVTETDADERASLEFKHSGYNFMARIGGNVTDKFALHGRVGLYFYDLETAVEFTDIPSGVSETGAIEDSGSDVTYGFGASYEIYESVELLAEYNIYNMTFGSDLSDDDESTGTTSVFSIGLSYNF